MKCSPLAHLRRALFVRLQMIYSPGVSVIVFSPPFTLHKYSIIYLQMGGAFNSFLFYFFPDEILCFDKFSAAPHRRALFRLQKKIPRAVSLGGNFYSQGANISLFFSLFLLLCAVFILETAGVNFLFSALFFCNISVAVCRNITRRRDDCEIDIGAMRWVQ